MSFATRPKISADRRVVCTERFRLLKTVILSDQPLLLLLLLVVVVVVVAVVVCKILVMGELLNSQTLRKSRDL